MWQGCRVKQRTFEAILDESPVELEVRMVSDVPPAKKLRLDEDQSIVPSTPELDKPAATGSSPRSVISYSCYNCPFTTNKYGAMKNHLPLHGSDGGIRCCLCLSKFKSLYGYQKHLKACTDNNPKPEAESVDDAEDEWTLDGDSLASLALTLQGRYRCSESVVNVIFSNLKHAFYAPCADLVKLRQSADMLTNQYRRQVVYKKMFKMPEIIRLPFSKALAVDFAGMITFLLQSPQILHYTKQSIRSNHFDIAIYSDDLSVTNPIGKSRKKHKIWVFYFQVLNLPPKYLSKTATIYPIAIALSSFVKNRDNLESLLSNFINQVQRLNDGVQLLVNGRERTITAKVIYFVGDSLAANAIAGFKEGFSSRTVRSCRMCNSTWDEFKSKVSHEDCNIRSLSEHLTRLNELDSGLSKASRQYWSKMYGVTQSSVLMRIPSFDVTKMVLFDPMHDLLEGAFPHQFELFLNFCVGNSLFTVRELNGWLQDLKYPSSMEKPGTIPESLKIKGLFGSGQTLTLARSLPLFLTNFDVTNPHFECIIRLIYIIQLCFAPFDTEEYVNDLKSVIEEHHCQFVSLYSDHFIPKIHFMKHYPYQVQSFGSLRKHMCLPFERKHQIIKNVRHFNFKNIPLSACKYLLANTASSYFDAAGNVKCDIFSDLDEVTMSNGRIRRLKSNGITYVTGDIVTVLSNRNLVFKLVKEIIAKDSHYYLESVTLKSSKQGCHYLCELDDNEAEIIDPNDLVFPWVVIHIKKNDKFFVSPVAIPSLS